MASNSPNEQIWNIFDNISKLYEDVHLQDNDLYIKTNSTNPLKVSQLISDASEQILKHLQTNEYNTDNNPQCTKFLHWLMALSMSFTNPPINVLKTTLIPHSSIIHPVLDIVFIHIIRKGLLFVNKENRHKAIHNYTANNDNKPWLLHLINEISFHKNRLLTPQFVKTLSKALILCVNILICETTAKDKSESIRNYFKNNNAFNTLLLYTLIQLLGTYVLPESIHCKSLEIHTKSDTNNNAQTESDTEMEQKSQFHNDRAQYISANRWRMAKSAQITIQFQRLLIKVIWIIVNEIFSADMSDIVYDLILTHSEQRVIMLQLMHFSVLSFECAQSLLQWICHKTYAYKDTHNPNHTLLYNLVYNISLSFIALCDEYQLEGNEFKVNMFHATLTTLEEEELINIEGINETIIPNSKQRNKYLSECGKKYMAYFANVFRFANSIDTIYTFHVQKTILIILPLITLCVKVRDQVMQRKECIEFLKELFYVCLPQCSYLFIRFQYERQYSIEDMVPILIKSRSGFNKDIILKFYANESKLQSNCITALHIFLYLADIDGISVKTIIKNLDRTSKREWRNYVSNMSLFIHRFTDTTTASESRGAMVPKYSEFDMKSRLESYIEYSKPKKIFSAKRHPNMDRDALLNEETLYKPSFNEYIHKGWIVKSEHKMAVQMCDKMDIDTVTDSAIQTPPFKKRKLNNFECKKDEYSKEDWPVQSIVIRLTKISHKKTRSKKQSRPAYRIRKISENSGVIYPDTYYSPCLAEMRLLSKWEPVIIKNNEKIVEKIHKKQQKMPGKRYKSESSSDESGASFMGSSSSEEEYKPPANSRNNAQNHKKKKRRSKRLHSKDNSDDSEKRSKRKRRVRRKKYKTKNRKKRRKTDKSDYEPSQNSNSNTLTSFAMLSESLRVRGNVSVNENAVKDLRLYSELKRGGNIQCTKDREWKYLLSPPTQKHPITFKKLNYNTKADTNGKSKSGKKGFMNLPDINKSFSAKAKSAQAESVRQTNNNNFNYHNNYNNNINININNYDKGSVNKKRNKIVDLTSRSSDEDMEKNKNMNLSMLTQILSNSMNKDATIRGLQQMLLSHGNNNGNNNENMFKIDPNIDTEQMSNHLFANLEQQISACNSDVSINNCARILLIAEYINDSIIRIECEDVIDDLQRNKYSHLERSINAAMKAVIFTNNIFIKNYGQKTMLFTVQMRAKKKIDLILDCFCNKSQICTFLKRCDSRMNRLMIDRSISVHSIAKSIIASVNSNKYIVLIPQNNDIKAVNIIVESMIVAHTAIKTQFKQITNSESFWLYCLIETTQNLPILGQTNNQISSNWLFKVVMNNNY